MRVKVSIFIKLLKWSLCVATLLLVKLFIIFPLAGLLFHDLYLRLLPPDSSQWVPLSTFHELKDELKFRQQIARIGVDRELPEALDNGLPQPIYLRERILYKMDLDLQFYCIHNWDSTPQSSIVELKIAIQDPECGHKLFSRKIPIVCLGEELPTVLGDSSMKYGTSRSELYRREWLNHWKLEDKVDIVPDTRSLRLLLEMGQPAQLIFDPNSGLRFRMRFTQGLINLMQRWHKTAYIVGITAFDLAITALFGITTLVTFTLVSKRLPKDVFKTR
ncbi:FLD1 (YLR404W) [Zygosaccharomyces parabailii]|nr:FLD1 (YLR404W) [Zygosaccharomyces parabailii]CDH10930.1 uncharacterized protein ZBAI_02716 [Zygosaccharomyces bailii ISA1307]